MNDVSRLKREKEFHDSRFGGDDSEREAAEKYYSIMELALNDYKSRAIRKCNKGSLLEYGCATGQESLSWLKSGVTLSGIDISGEAISKAKNNLLGTGFESKASYFEMNAEETDFEDSSFDVIVGNGIIHHLDLDKAYLELSRILKPSGSAIFIEPTGHNPLINLYRFLTPAMRTEDEHPLLMADIDKAGRYFENIDSSHYNLFSLMAVPFRNTSSFKPLLNGLHAFDAMLFKIPGFKKLGWTVVLELSNPKK